MMLTDTIAQVLLQVSENEPRVLYPEWDYFVELLSSQNGYHRATSVQIIASLTKVDTEKRFDAMLDQYFDMLDDGKVMMDGTPEMEDGDLKKIEMRPIGFVSRTSPHENERDRSLVSKIVLIEGLAQALDGIEDWSHVYVIYWLNKVLRNKEPVLHFPSTKVESPPLGIFATRAPIHPNPIGLTLVELIRRERNVLFVRGLDAYDGTPILDIKPYPDWEQGRFIVVTDFRVPEWLTRIIKQHG